MARNAPCGHFKSDAECAHALGKLEEEPCEQIRKACAPDPALFRRLAKPRRGDWLAEHQETGQMFTSYRRKMDKSRRPSKCGHTILLVPLGKSFGEGVAALFLPHIIAYCRAFFAGMEVEVLIKPLSLKDVSRRENSFEDRQYIISELFEMLNTHKDVRKHPAALRAYCRLGVTMEDIYPGEDWEYVYGQAKPLERVGVFSFARHSPLFYQGVHASDAFAHLSARELVSWLRACLRTMVHETGHMLGLLHCVYYQCLMNGSNGPGDSAGRSSFLCPICLRKFFACLADVPGRAVPMHRYALMLDALLDVARDVGGAPQTTSEEVGHSFAGDIAWLMQRIQFLGGEVPVELAATSTACVAAADAGHAECEDVGEATDEDELKAAPPPADLERWLSDSGVLQDALAEDPPMQADLVRCTSEAHLDEGVGGLVPANMLVAFREWDSEGQGIINREQLERILVSLGMPEAEVPRIVAGSGKFVDGTDVVYEEFLDWLCAASLAKPGERVGRVSDEGPMVRGDIAEAIVEVAPAPGAPPPVEESEAKTIAARRQSLGGAFQVNTTACVGKSSLDLFSAVAADLGWKQVTVSKKTTRKPTIHCVMQSHDLLERLPGVGAGSWVSRYLGMPDLCDKGNFARMVKSCMKLSGEAPWHFVPKTWVLPADWDALKEAVTKSQARPKKTTYIIKPEDGSQGDGIFMIQTVRDLEVKMSTKANSSAVCQRYISKPLVLNGFKFDLRVYVLVAGGSCRNMRENPPAVFVCKEGLARFCTQKYTEPSGDNLHKCMGHLTNYSLNKRSEDFVHGGETLDTVLDPCSDASKRPLTAVLKQMEVEIEGFHAEAFYVSLAEIIGTSLASMAPVLAATHAGACPERDAMRCFHLLGFDVMLDSDLAPHLLEVNNSPSLCIDEIFPLEPGQDAAGAQKGKRGERDRPCLCMEMSGPHRHQTSLVDLFVKTTAMSGAFRLLEQLNEGVDEPGVDDYIAADIGSSAVYDALCRVGTLFQRCGGAAKAFSSSGMRRHLGSLAGHGILEKHDFDSLSLRLRGASSFVNRDTSTQAQACRIFDFVDMLQLLAERAFPGDEPSDALQKALTTLGV